MEVVQVHNKRLREGKVIKSFHSFRAKSLSNYQSAEVLEVPWMCSYKMNKI